MIRKIKLIFCINRKRIFPGNNLIPHFKRFTFIKRMNHKCFDTPSALKFFKL